jgi:hypothetical protein
MKGKKGLIKNNMPSSWYTRKKYPKIIPADKTILI